MQVLTMITIDPSVFWGSVGILVAAIAFGIREYFKTRREAQAARSYTEKQQSDGQLVIDKAQAAVLADISAIARQGVKTQEKMLEVVAANSDAFNRYTKAEEMRLAEIKALNVTLSDQTSAIRAATVGMDETGVTIAALATSIGKIDTATEGLEANLGATFREAFTSHLGPVVQSLSSIDERLKTLAFDLASKDSTIVQHFSELTAAFQDAKNQFATLLEPLVLRHISDLLPTDNNGKEKDAS
jgi:hypothetical protein